MSFVKVNKEYTFDCAHRLANHEGLCNNIHGHTYRMQVELEGKRKLCPPAVEGMILDFKELKRVVKELIVDPIDHAYVLNHKSMDEKDIAVEHMMNKLGFKTFIMGSRPTAENMAVEFAEKLKYSELTREHKNIKSITVKIWETPTSYAEYKIPVSGDC